MLINWVKTILVFLTIKRIKKITSFLEFIKNLIEVIQDFRLLRIIIDIKLCLKNHVENT